MFTAAAAATGILSLYGTPALADSFAGGGAEDSPGVLSGNSVQAPVHVPVNACGNDVTVVGAGNSASDNTCANVSGGAHGGERSSDRSAHSHHEASSHSESGGAHAVGAAKGSPGLLSGNLVQAPVHVPVNACGNSVNVVGLFNAASDNTCVNESGHEEKEPEKTPEKDKPEPPTVKTPPTPVEPPAVHTPDGPPHLAETGTDGLMAASAAAAVLLTGGAVLYRRGRVGARR